MKPTHDSGEHSRPDPKHEPFPIHIDRTTYMVDTKEMTGAQLRALPNPPIGPDRDLYQVVPGGEDIPVANDQVVHLEQGMHFVTAPHVNPGSNHGGC